MWNKLKIIVKGCCYPTSVWEDERREIIGNGNLNV